MNKRNLILVAAAVVALVGLSVCRKGQAQKTAATETFGAAPVKVFKVGRARITEKITYTGTLEAWTKITHASCARTRRGRSSSRCPAR